MKKAFAALSLAALLVVGLAGCKCGSGACCDGNPPCAECKEHMAAKCADCKAAGGMCEKCKAKCAECQDCEKGAKAAK